MYNKKKKTYLFSRRHFLQGLTLAGMGAVLPLKAHAKKPKPELTTLFDIDKCIGCKNCVLACREKNAAVYPKVRHFPALSPSGTPVEDFSKNKDACDRLTPYNWLYIQEVDVTYKGKDFSLNIPRRCMHCQSAPCISLCPFGAVSREASGAVRIHSDVCLGGAKCRKVCPWHIPQRQSGVGLYLKLMPRFAGNGVLYKCDGCYKKVAVGEQPACIGACPSGVQTIGPREEIIQTAKELAATRKGYIYGLYENGGTNTLYVSPVPFPVLQKKLAVTGELGPGKPHLEPVRPVMQHRKILGTALAIAPLAGVAAGMLSIRKSKRR